MCMFGRVELFETLWTVTRQASLSMEFSRQEYQSGLPIPIPGDLPDPGIEPTTLTSPALMNSLLVESPGWVQCWKGVGSQSDLLLVVVVEEGRGMLETSICLPLSVFLSL